MEIKAKITEKFIDLLQFEGWNDQTLAKACAEAGFEENYVGVVYPGKIEQFSKEFADECNILALQEFRRGLTDKSRTTEKARDIIFTRIAVYHNILKTPEALKKLIAYGLNPLHVGQSASNIYNFASDAWYELGDKSTDFSYYTKRISLSAIYTKSIFYSLSDKSNNLEATKKFIERTIDGLMKINKLKQKVKQFTNIFPKPVGKFK